MGDDPSSGFPDRRALLAGIAKLAVVGTIVPGPLSAAIVAADDKRLKTAAIHWPVGGGRQLHGYMAIPAKARGRQPAILVVHDDRGLTDHIRDVARRVALGGFVACAPDFLSSIGARTPSDGAVARAMIGSLDRGQAASDAAATVRWLGTNRYATGKVGAIGFGWGGALIDGVAARAGAALTAAVSYYGVAPDPAGADDIKAAILLHSAGLDDRAGAGLSWINALRAAGVSAGAYVYEGAARAFDDDSAAEHYDAGAATLAWDRTMAFFAERLR